MNSAKLLRYSMQLSMLKQLRSLKLISEAEYQLVEKKLKKIIVLFLILPLDYRSVALYDYINTMVGTQKERGGEMEVEIIKAKGAGEDTSTGRKIDRLRVAAYCRVSTDDEDQIKSYNSMVRYYTDLIKSNKQWVFAGVFADKAITGTKTDKREEFQLLIQECLSGNIDLVIAKSIPRFARNTLDTLKYVRMLRERNIAVYFEVEKLIP